MKSNKYEFFWDGPFSQWHRSPMTIDGVEYDSCEQYMMHQKAILFKDFIIADKILKTTNPNDQKQLGRQIKGFDKAIWDRVNFQIVYKGNLAKFSQNKDLKKQLLDTGNKILVEASPYDSIWGIGLGVKEAEDGKIDIKNPNNWKGQNLLGWAITLVKQELK